MLLWHISFRLAVIGGEKKETELRATMREWLFVLTVLATFKPIVQVASTDIISKTLDSAIIERFEKTLLTQLGMEQRPKGFDRTKIIVPYHLKDVYNKLMVDQLGSESVNLPLPGVHTKSANTVRSFAHEESKIDDRFRDHHYKFRLFFNVSNIPQNEKLKAAELILSRQQLLAKDHDHKLLIYDILKPGRKGKTDPIFLLIDSVNIDGGSSRSNSNSNSASSIVTIDLLPAVDRWLKNPKENYGILICLVHAKTLHPAKHRHVRLKRSNEDTHENWLQQQPFLFTYTDDGRYEQRKIRDVIGSNDGSRRSRRAPARRAHKRRDGREICQRRPLYVDFSSVGWSDWIVAPPGYDAYYCHGECQFPIADHLNSTNHAVVQTLVNSINREMAPKACCVPTQLKPISMLYLDDQNKVVLKNYQDMTVVGCGCR